MIIIEYRLFNCTVIPHLFNISPIATQLCTKNKNKNEKKWNRKPNKIIYGMMMFPKYSL